MHGIDRGYVIAALPRTGSFLLCDILAAQGSAGYPQEYGLPEDLATWKDHHGYDSHRAYFFDFFRFCRTPNRTFGCKLMWPQFIGLRRDIRRYTCIGGSGMKPIEAMTGPLKVIFLDRRDIVMQAISLVRAMETNIWSSHRTSATPDLTYDRASIARAIDAIESNRRLWEAFFELHALQPLRLFYEDIANNDASAAFRFLGTEAPKFSHKTRLKRQADDLSREWYDQFVTARPD